MATVYEMFEKPSALTAAERAEYVALWERVSMGRVPRADFLRYVALRRRMLAA